MSYMNSDGPDWPPYRILHTFHLKELIFFLLLHKNICCGYSSEAPQWGASDGYPKHSFLWRNKKNIMWQPHLILSNEQWHSLVRTFFIYQYSHQWFREKTKKSMIRLGNVHTDLLSFRHLSESRFLLGALNRRRKFANFCHDLMQNHLS